VFEDSAFNRSFFPELPLDQNDQTELSYSLKLGSRARIAGHYARNLKVLPRDKYRYGYSLWLEEHSGLLLKWEMIDSKQRSLAQLMFTDIRLGSEVDVNELKPTTQLKKFKTVASELPSGRGISKTTPKWQPDRLPPGFQLTAHRYFGQQDQGVYEHLVYSDGLATISVYIESASPDSNTQAGVNRLGTTHAFSRLTDAMLITVVGDVPAITVKSIGDAVKSVSP
jgi:sigma-E factor negative regulatory protein RseB